MSDKNYSSVLACSRRVNGESRSWLAIILTISSPIGRKRQIFGSIKPKSISMTLQKSIKAYSVIPN